MATEWFSGCLQMIRTLGIWKHCIMIPPSTMAEAELSVVAALEVIGAESLYAGKLASLMRTLSAGGLGLF